MNNKNKFKKCKQCEWDKSCPHAYKKGEGACNGGDIGTPSLDKICETYGMTSFAEALRNL